MIPQKEFSQLGELLKKRRQERNLSLKEIENATSIRMNFLNAIEEGEMEKLISPIYAHGFIKKYANLLEIDVEKFFAEFPIAMRPQNEETLAEKQEFTLGIGSVEVRGGGASEVKWLPNLLWVGLSVLGILAAWFLAKYFGII
jgi:cytoskeletal protein RodZ